MLMDGFFSKKLYARTAIFFIVRVLTNGSRCMGGLKAQ